MQQANYNFDICFTPMLDIGFWTTLAKKKLDEYKLDTEPQPITAKYKINNYKDKGANSNLFFDVYSFIDEKSLQIQASGPVEILLKGDLVILNTIEEFRCYNKEKALNKLIENFHFDGKMFLMVVFADLKSHLFHYMFLWPNLKVEDIKVQEIHAIENEFVKKRIYINFIFFRDKD